MHISEEPILCPYPGLRSFNEEEAIYFRGRDEQIESITALLERNKFLMVTGASGDGKSSLIYAGLVPNARAGFFKARFNNWAVADFRPERTPLRNMAKSIATHLRFDKNSDTVETELGYGFSALADLYKTSSLYVDTWSDAYRNADTAVRQQLSRSAANLLIIVDQFEEFFTYPENYHNGAASPDSRTVVNLLLETTRIAVRDNLPIYIVCTMRSDYIGQCAAFRGLPEMIGSSQFFVPRLKRREIEQVIEEPAALSGQVIAMRLTQRLTADMSDELDQLPILQHALYRICKVSGEDHAERMDLLHYAKVGGMPKDELPEESRAQFEQWYADQSEFHKTLLAHPCLDNVLDEHANMLYETAHEHYNALHTPAIAQEEAQQIIKTAFQCLTRIDNGRAVRNRMTLAEITDILNLPACPVERVGRVLDLFRLQGNTFIRPFITDEPETDTLQPETVLDITHESLIRNWTKLGTWAEEEYNSLTVYRDFRNQLDRWVSSGRKSGFLLSIGSLTYFETWYNHQRPNVHWLARYDEQSGTSQERLARAEQTLADMQEFLRRNARKHLATRFVLRYGGARIATLLVLLLGGIVLLSWYLDRRSTAEYRSNPAVLQRITDRGTDLLRSPKVSPQEKAEFLISQERIHPGSFRSLLNGIGQDSLQARLALSTFNELFRYDRFGVLPLKMTALLYADSLIRRTKTSVKTLHDQERRIVLLTHALRSFADWNRIVPSDALQKAIAQQKEELYEHLTFMLSDIPDTVKWNATVLRSAIDQYLTTLSAPSSESEEHIHRLLQAISPFEQRSVVQRRFATIFPAEEKTQSVYQTEALSHNGGYQMLASLYAAVGDMQNVHRCVDSILRYNERYFSFDTNTFFDVMSRAAQFGHIELIQPAIARYTKAELKHTDTWYEKFLQLTPLRYPYIYREQRERLWDMYRTDIQTDKNINKDEQHFRLALYYKQRGLTIESDPVNATQSEDITRQNQYFSQAVEQYRMVGSTYTQEPMEGVTSVIKEPATRAVYFLSPGRYDAEKGDFAFSTAMLTFMNNYPIRELFRSNDSTLPAFMRLYFDQYLQQCAFTPLSVPIGQTKAFFAFYHTLLDSLPPMRHHIDSTVFSAFEMLYAPFTSGTKKQTSLPLEFSAPDDLYLPAYHQLLAEAGRKAALEGKIQEAFQRFEHLGSGKNRILALVRTALALDQNNRHDQALMFLDSAQNAVERESFMQKFWDIRSQMVYALIAIDGTGQMPFAVNLIKDMDNIGKPQANRYLLRALAEKGLYFEAAGTISPYVSPDNELSLYNEILRRESKRQEAVPLRSLHAWAIFDEAVTNDPVLYYYVLRNNGTSDIMWF